MSRCLKCGAFKLPMRPGKKDSFLSFFYILPKNIREIASLRNSVARHLNILGGVFFLKNFPLQGQAAC